MAWLDWLKDVPVSAVVKERLALKEEQFNELKRENEELVKRVGVLEAANAKLKRRLRRALVREQFVDFKGVLWKKKLGGGFEETPHCPSCRFIMAYFYDGYACRRCKISSHISRESVEEIIEDILRITIR